MPVQINDINVIDDNRNVSAAGIVTVGTGNSATIIDGTTGITSVGIGITMEGISGNISIAGTLTAAGFNIPTSIISFSPANGSTDVDDLGTISITFDQAVGVGTIGNIYLRNGSAGGTTIQTFGISDVTISNANTLNITPTSSLGYSVDVYPVIEEGFIKSTSGDFVGLNTTGADSYSFTTVSGPVLGTSYEGGTIICQSGGVRWVVAPRYVSATWHNRNSAVSDAQSVSGCTGWFVPTLGQLGNPMFACRTYWDACGTCHWSDTDTCPGFAFPDYAWALQWIGGTTTLRLKGETWCVRALRCVTY